MLEGVSEGMSEGVLTGSCVSYSPTSSALLGCKFSTTDATNASSLTGSSTVAVTAAGVVVVVVSVLG